MAKDTDCEEAESENKSLEPESPLNETNLKPNNMNLKLDINESHSGSTSQDNSPSVSDNSVKTTVLGIRQAKKRLQAFSLMKQTMLPISPLLKRTPKQQKVSIVKAKTYDENGKETEEKVIVKKPARKGKCILNVKLSFLLLYCCISKINLRLGQTDSCTCQITVVCLATKSFSFKVLTLTKRLSLRK